MEIEYDLTQPIYLQIMQRVNSRIVRGEFKPGEKLPSIVDAGLEYGVNHNTVGRVYSEMVRLGILETRRGEGTFVTKNPQMIENLHQTLRDELLDTFFKEMARLGYSNEEIQNAFLAYYQKMIQINAENGAAS